MVGSLVDEDALVRVLDGIFGARDSVSLAGVAAA